MSKKRSVSVFLRRITKEYHGIAVTAAIFAAISVFFVFAVANASNNAGQSVRASLEKAITRAAVQCYAIEGFYPPDIDYLIDNYGLIVDTKKYFVTYNAVAVNIFPDIKIFDN